MGRITEIHGVQLQSTVVTKASVIPQVKPVVSPNTETREALRILKSRANVLLQKMTIDFKIEGVGVVFFGRGRQENYLGLVATATVDSTLQAFAANTQGLVGDIRSELRLMLGQPLRDITVVKTPFTREFIIATQSGEPVASLRCLQNDEGYDYFVADVCLLEELPEIA